MDSEFKFKFKCSIFICSLILFQLVCGNSSSNRKILQIHTHMHKHGDQMGPEIKIFFTPDDLKAGKKLQIYFAPKDSSAPPPLLSRDEAVSIPFSSASLPTILKLFSFSPSSPQAEAMGETLRHCEFGAIKDEIKFCATSLEAMLDSVREIAGPGSRIRVLTTEFVKGHPAALQNYSVAGDPREVQARQAVGCHSLPYPYAVFYCHSQKIDTKIFIVTLVGESREDRVEAVAICHMDTSRWNSDHVSFRVLGIVPRSSPVCHFFPQDNLVWVASDSVEI